MLIDKLNVLRAAKLVLASGSPRRKEILNEILGLDVRVVPSTFAEDLDHSKFTPESYAQENARVKALEVWHALCGKFPDRLSWAIRSLSISDRGCLSPASGDEAPDIVIGGDTVVSSGGLILEKPRDRQHAIDMLAGLSGTTHTVYSGVALVYRQ